MFQHVFLEAVEQAQQGIEFLVGGRIGPALIADEPQVQQTPDAMGLIVNAQGQGVAEFGEQLHRFRRDTISVCGNRLAD